MRSLLWTLCSGTAQEHVGAGHTGDEAAVLSRVAHAAVLGGQSGGQGGSPSGVLQLVLGTMRDYATDAAVSANALGLLQRLAQLEQVR